MRWCIRKSVTTSWRSRPPWGARISRGFRHRSPAVMATSNSSSARAVAEHLVIDHVGHFGDGVALAGGENVYVPDTLGGETRGVAPVGGHPDRRRLLQVEHASLERITPFCPHFGICGGCAIQHWEREHYRAWKRDIVIETPAQAKLDCRGGFLIPWH